MYNYIDLLKEVIKNGKDVQTRNGIRRTCYQANLHYDLQEGFPIVTTRKIFWRGITTELCWFLNGDTNTKYLTDRGVHIWDGNASDNGNCGPIYGFQWRNFNGSGIDQIQNLIDDLITNPNSTRHIVTAWNPEQQRHMKLPACHCFFQCHVEDEEILHMQVSLRSSDVTLGLPFNISSYALLTHILAKRCGYRIGHLWINLGNVHMYKEHLTTALDQIRRDPLPLPELSLTSPLTHHLYNLDPLGFKLINYEYHPAMKYDLIV